MEDIKKNKNLIKQHARQSSFKNLNELMLYPHITVFMFQHKSFSIECERGPTGLSLHAQKVNQLTA